jgi:phosphatidylserine decarboxylase precursor
MNSPTTEVDQNISQLYTSTKPWLASIDSLQFILQSRPDLREALEISIQKAGVDEVKTIPQYVEFLEKILTAIPRDRMMDNAVMNFHFLVSYSPGNILTQDETFTNWLAEFARNHGKFLDTVESGKAIDTFMANPEYNIDDYDPGPSGWLTFNQFFTRRLKPGKRPIADRCNDHVIVAPTDSIYLGCWPIDEQSTIEAKGSQYYITELLDGIAFANEFKNGIFTHSYLNITDYHRYHVPVDGIVREARKIPGKVIVEIGKDEKGERTVTDNIGFQFKQARGLVILDTSIGLIALVPVGMGHTSSVNFTAETNTELIKGEEFGYFAQGGSDMIMLFQSDKIHFTAKVGTHYKVGEQIAMFHP